MKGVEGFRKAEWALLRWWIVLFVQEKAEGDEEKGRSDLEKRRKGKRAKVSEKDQEESSRIREQTY